MIKVANFFFPVSLEATTVPVLRPTSRTDAGERGIPSRTWRAYVLVREPAASPIEPPEGHPRPLNQRPDEPAASQNDDPRRDPEEPWIRRSRSRKLDGSIPQFFAPPPRREKPAAPASRFRSLTLPPRPIKRAAPFRIALVLSCLRPGGREIRLGSTDHRIGRASLRLHFLAWSPDQAAASDPAEGRSRGPRTWCPLTAAGRETRVDTRSRRSGSSPITTRRGRRGAASRPDKHPDESPCWVHAREPDKLGVSREDR